MALGTNHIQGSNVTSLTTTVSDVTDFIPQLWSDDVLAAYKSNLVMAGLVRKINHKGKKGDVLHIPVPTRESASAKTRGSQVTLVGSDSSEVQVQINNHYEYSTIIEDILSVQALGSLRRFYTDDAGYALAKQIDSSIFAEMETTTAGGTTTAGTAGGNAWGNAVIGGDGSTAYDQTANTNTGNGTALTDAGIRKMIQLLDDVDTPNSGRVLVIPPVARNVLMGLSRFTEQAFTGEAGMGNTIRNGKIGDLYGVEVFVSSNCPTETAADASTQYRIGAMFQKDSLVLAEQMGVRSQTQYKQEYLGSLYTADCIYGTKAVRPYGAVAIAMPA